MAKYKYITNPYGYSNRDLPKKVRATCNSKASTQFHLAYRASAVLQGYACKRLPKALQKQFLETVGENMAAAKRLADNACIEILIAMNRSLSNTRKK